jgi:hypothetical protein
MVFKVSADKKDKHSSRISIFKRQAKDLYIYEGIEFPTTYDDIYRLERLNKVCIYVCTASPKEEIVLDKLFVINKYNN